MFIASTLRLVIVAVALGFAGVVQEEAAISGRWVGLVDTDRGQMEIALDVTRVDGKYSGEMKTAHGGWPVTSVEEKDGMWALTFGSADEGGAVKGRVAGEALRGEWKMTMATGTFELQRVRRR